MSSENMAAKLIHVVHLGASGTTGGSIAHAILDLPDVFRLTAFARPSSVEKLEYANLKKHGATVVPADMNDINEDLIETMRDADVVICTAILDTYSATPMNNFAMAARKAGVKRFVPSLFGPCAPGRDVTWLREIKEDLIDHINAIGLPYTFIDAGWWYQLSLPRLPSGRIDDHVTLPVTHITGSGDVESAMIDNANIGKFVARIIADPQTLNKYVFVHDEVWTQNQIFDLLEHLAGEKLPRHHVSKEDLDEKIARLQKLWTEGDRSNVFEYAMLDYFYSMCIRGDNTLQKAKDLGYLIGKELYPDIERTNFEDYVKKLLEGSAVRS